MAVLSADGTKILNNYDRFTGEPFNATKYATLPTGVVVDNVIWFKNKTAFGGGFAKRDFTGAINVKWFGAKGDGITDDTDSIIIALRSGSGYEVNFTEGTYIVSPSVNKFIRVYSNTIITSDKKALIKVKDNNQSFETVFGSETDYVENIVFDGLNLDHNRQNLSGTITTEDREQIFSFYNYKNITVKNSNIVCAGRNSLNFNSSISNGLSIHDNYFLFRHKVLDDYYDNSVIYFEGTNASVINNKFYVAEQSIGFATCPIEVHGSNITVKNNTVYSFNVGVNAVEGFDDFDNQGNILVSENTFIDVNNGVHIWVLRKELNNVTVKDNIIKINQFLFSDSPDATAKFACTGVRLVDIYSNETGSFNRVSKNWDVSNNTISFKIETTGSSERQFLTGGVVLDFVGTIDGLTVIDNSVENSPAVGLSMSKRSANSKPYQNVLIRNNTVRNNGLNIQAPFLQKSCFLFNADFINTRIEQNNVIDYNSTLSGGYLYYMPVGRSLVNVSIKDGVIDTNFNTYPVSVSPLVDYLPPISNNKFTSGNPITSNRNGNYKTGDILWNTLYVFNSHNYAFYKCTDSGTISSLNISGLTANVVIGNEEITISDSSKLSVGNVIRFNGLSSKHTIVSKSGNKCIVTPTPTITSGTATVTFYPPSFLGVAGYANPRGVVPTWTGTIGDVVPNLLPAPGNYASWIYTSSGWQGVGNVGFDPATKANADIHSVINYASIIDVDFNNIQNVHTISLGGNLTVNTFNYSVGKKRTLRIISDSAERSLTFQEGWTWVTAKPLSIPANKTGILEIYCFGSLPTEVVAKWFVQP